MRTAVTPVTGHWPRRRLLPPRAPDGRARSGELAAGLTALAAAQALLAPAVLLTAAGLIVAGRLTRWRPSWLSVPLLAGGYWLAAEGFRRSAAALAHGGARLASAELAVASRPGRLLQPGTLGIGAGRWIPQQLPLALLAGSAEAAVTLLACWQCRGRPAWRPGLAAVTRQLLAAPGLRAGRTVTARGCVVGLVTATGKRAEFTWAAAERGVLVTGSDATQIARPALAVVCAAIRRRKPVIVIELGPGGRSPGLRHQAVAAGHRLGVPVTELSAGCRDYGGVLGRAIRDRAVVVAGAGSRAGDTGSRADGTAAGAGGSGDPGAGVTGSCPGAAGRSAVTVLAAILAGLRDLGLRADCLAVVSGCEELEPGAAADLLTAAREAGTAVLLLTTSAHAAGGLVPPAGTTIVCGRLPGIWLHQFAGADAAGMCAPGAEALGPDRDWRGRQRDALRDLARGDLAIMAGGSPRPVVRCQSFAIGPVIR